VVSGSVVALNGGDQTHRLTVAASVLRVMRSDSCAAIERQVPST